MLKPRLDRIGLCLKITSTQVGSSEKLARGIYSLKEVSQFFKGINSHARGRNYLPGCLKKTLLFPQLL